MNLRTVSFAIAYLMLLVATFVAEAVLVSVFISSVTQRTSELPSIVETFGTGVVYGAYSIAPYYKQVSLGSNRYATVYVRGLHIILVNPNPLPTEVVLLGYYKDAPGTYKVLDIAETFGIEWDEGKNPPPGVQLVQNPKWFPDAQRAIRLMPHTSVSFRVPSYYGTPVKLLACTPMGCTKLGSVGEMDINPTTPEPWIITVDNPSRSPPPTVSQTWTWEAVTIGGPAYVCEAPNLGPVPPKSTIAISPCGFKVLCCKPCPSGCNPTGIGGGRAPCSEADTGSIDSYSLAAGMPPNVIAGFYTTDSKFSFRTPTTISIGSTTYKIYGLSKGPNEANPEIIDQRWIEYDRQSCFIRKIKITAVVKPVINGDNVKFSKLWGSSTGIYVYVATRGYYTQWQWWNPIRTPYERDTVNITVYYRVGSDKPWIPLGSIEASDNNFVDNSAELRTNPTKWRIPIDASEIKIEITYTMEGPRDHVSSACFQSLFGYPLFCGYSYDRNVRLAFYVELIPTEYLS
jgi:hypothetical protein